MRFGHLDRLFVAGVGVAGDAAARIGGQHTLQPPGCFGGAVGDDDHAGVLAVADAHAGALRIGQSEMASEPSFIPSVSRRGEATEPASRWSRPMTMGAWILPLATNSLKASPALARSP